MVVVFTIIEVNYLAISLFNDLVGPFSVYCAPLFKLIDSLDIFEKFAKLVYGVSCVLVYFQVLKSTLTLVQIN